MVLVDYPDSESENDVEHSGDGTLSKKPFEHESDTGSRKRKFADRDEVQAQPSKPPPLPSSLHSLYATEARTSTSDDPILHGGRRRQIPHTAGRWPSHVYLEWVPGKDDCACLENMITKAKDQFRPQLTNSSKPEIHTFLQSALGVQLPLHISLSAPLILSTNDKEEFLSSVRDKIKSNAVRVFKVTPLALDWVPNFNRSRFFLVLRMMRPPGDELNELLRYCNQVCRASDLPLLYQQDGSVGVAGSERTSKKAIHDGDILDADKSDAFHISIAWTLQQPSNQMVQNVRSINAQDFKIVQICFKEVKVKIGNIISELGLLDSF